MPPGEFKSLKGLLESISGRGGSVCAFVQTSEGGGSITGGEVDLPLRDVNIEGDMDPVDTYGIREWIDMLCVRSKLPYEEREGMITGYNSSFMHPDSA